MKTEEKLRNELTPKYDWLFWYLGRLEHGVKFLVDLRRDVLVILLFIIHYCNLAISLLPLLRGYKTLLINILDTMFFRMLGENVACYVFDGFC